MKFNRHISIDKKVISDNSPVFIIAEAGVNHNGNIKNAELLIDIAVEAKADAVKFQAFKTEELILENISKAPYQCKTTSTDDSQSDMLRKLELSLSDNQHLMEYCNSKGIIFLTTPFDEKSLDELNILDLPAYKIASTDTTNLPFLKRIAAKGKPMIFSSGMSYMDEIRLALETIFEINKDCILLQCTANYPIADKEANLAVINTFQDEFDILIGYSDHSTGSGAAAYAVPMGAKVIEKHFTLDKNLPGPDHMASLSPEQLKEFVLQIRKVEQYLGTPEKKPTKSELDTRKSLQKCLVAARNIPEGIEITLDDIVAKRTGGKGISPIYYQKVVGSKAICEFRENDIIILEENM